MTFIANGDFQFPFSIVTFMAKQFYIWSYQAGALNLDGIIRIYSKLPLVAVFLIGDNVIVGYAYIAISLGAAFCSFYYFLNYFKFVHNKSFQWLLSLLFVINPAFLGNMSKVGLILAVAMLPLLLVLVHKIIAASKYPLIIVLAIAFNISLIHPFTFAVNGLIVGIFTLYMAGANFAKVRRHVKSIVSFGLVALLLNAYLLLPLISLGTINKTSLSQDSEQLVNYTDFIYVSNTEDIFTSFSFAKDVFKDYNFYDADYQKYYYASAFLLYALILSLYLKQYRRLSQSKRALLLIASGAFLLVSLIATVSLLNIDIILKTLTTLPGGWTFRSPLKWQLYQPFFLILALAIILSTTQFKLRTRVAYCCLFAISLVGLNGYIVIDIYINLLKPRTVEQFSQLNNLDLEHKRLLRVVSPDCPILYESDRSADIEYKQIMQSKNVQQTTIQQSKLNQTSYADFDYLISCQEELRLPTFEQILSYPSQGIFVLKNITPQQHIQSLSELYQLVDNQDLEGKSRLVKSEFDSELNYAVNQHPQSQLGPAVFSLFGDLRRNGIDSNRNIISDQLPISTDQLESFTYYQFNDQEKVEQAPLSNIAQRQSNPLSVASSDSSTTINYQVSTIKLRNLISNSSFEESLWQEEVSDCYRYDDSPDINMSRGSSGSQGSFSLQLEAGRHIACTSYEVSVTPNSEYLFYFDYQSPNLATAGYRLEYPEQSDDLVLAERITPEDNQWNQYDRVIKTPAKATKLVITVYSYQQESIKSINRYDNFGLVQIPPIRHQHFVVQKGASFTREPTHLSYKIDNPTRKLISVEGAKLPFYIKMNEAYHNDWRLVSQPYDAVAQFSPLATQPAIDDSQHFQINQNANGWYVDPVEICADNNSACTQNEDGSWDMQLVAEFYPQRWFYLGALISSITFLGCVGFFILLAIKKFRHRHDPKIDPHLIPDIT